jgi:hypothetical protein
MVRRMGACLLLAVAAALAQDPDEEIRQARQTLEEFLKIGDELARQGKRDAALKTYREAARAYDEAMQRIGDALLRPAPEPPADLAHLPGTPADLRQRIDDLVAVMLDPQAGSEALQAKAQLETIGKPAFPRVLGAMARVRDRITDRDSREERLLESGLELADRCLRGMDGYLDAKEKAALHPGVAKHYIRYILREHYRRWNEKLKDANEMPGPHRPLRDRAAPASKWDPPKTLGHLASTPAERRREIDRLVDILFDPEAGRACLEAREKLAALGRPVFPVILGRMAAIRDTLTDDDTMKERLIESTLMLADQCLRRIDPYLDDHGKALLRPGTDAKYVRYILRLHYRRWTEALSKEAD